MAVKRIRNCYILALVIIVILLCAAGCGKVAGNTTVTTESTSATSENTPPVVSAIPGHSITVQDAKTLLDSGSNAAIFIDVRTQADYDTLHIPGAVLIPIEELPSKLSEIPIDKVVIIYAQCR